jgi:hypothetical protein
LSELQEWQRKIDHRILALWAHVPEDHRGSHRVTVFVRFRGSTGALAHLGLEVHSLAGDIASATIVLADLANIANAPQVLFIEAAHPLAYDK